MTFEKKKNHTNLCLEHFCDRICSEDDGSFADVNNHLDGGQGGGDV